MADIRISNLADILVNYSVEVEPGHLVGIDCWPFNSSALPYLQEVTRAVLKAGAHPLFDLEPEFFSNILFDEGDDSQISFVDPRMIWGAQELDRSITFTCEENTHRLSGVDPERQARRSAAYREFQDIFYGRAAEGSMRWVYTLVPTSAYAQDAEMSLEEFENFFFKATFADIDNPIDKLTSIREEQDRIISWLAGKKELIVQGPNVDLTLSIKGRPFINCYGDANLPDGEIFTAPVEDSAVGWIRFTYPAVSSGREVAGVELQFEAGKAVKATAEKNEEFLLASLNMDRGARFIGEFAFGMNKAIDRHIKNILFDEKIGGTIHLALGFGYPESGSKNKSALHWDMICDMKGGGQVLADGEMFYKDGEFLI